MLRVSINALKPTNKAVQNRRQWSRLQITCLDDFEEKSKIFIRIFLSKISTVKSHANDVDSISKKEVLGCQRPVRHAL